MNENEIQVWNYESSEIRTVQVNGEPWFVGKDVADILGYQNGSRDINRHVEEEDRCKIMIFDGRQDKETIVINESGLYSLILSSNLPNAKQFKRWVTSEVLPSIRKHGSYSVQSQFADLSPQLQVLIQMETRQKQIEARQAEQATALAGLEQKIQNTCEVIALDKTAWRKDSEHLINKIARATGEGLWRYSVSLRGNLSLHRIQSRRFPEYPSDQQAESDGRRGRLQIETGQADTD